MPKKQKHVRELHQQLETQREDGDEQIVGFHAIQQHVSSVVKPAHISSELLVQTDAKSGGREETSRQTTFSEAIVHERR